MRLYTVIINGCHSKHSQRRREPIRKIHTKKSHRGGYVFKKKGLKTYTVMKMALIIVRTWVSICYLCVSVCGAVYDSHDNISKCVPHETVAQKIANGMAAVQMCGFVCVCDMFVMHCTAGVSSLIFKISLKICSFQFIQ